MAEEIKKEMKEQETKEIQTGATEAPAEQKPEQAKEEGKKPEKEKPKADSKKESAKKGTKSSAAKETKQKKETAKKETAKTEKEKEKKEEVKPELPPIQYKSFASSSKNVAIHSLMLQVKSGKLNLDHPVQRKASQWDVEKKSKFINSLISGIISPEIIICEKDGERFLIDGKQRTSTLYEYVVKKDNPKLKVFGRTFDELDEATKDQLTGSNINVVTYANIQNDSEIFDLFERYNNGVALSSSQKSRAYCSIALLAKIKDILSKPFFTEKANLTQGNLLKDEDTIVLIQSAMLVAGFDFKSFNGKEVDRFLQQVAEDEIMQTLEEVSANVDILDGVLENQKYKNLKKIHLPMIIACAEDTELFKVKLLDFLDNYENESNEKIQNYRSHCMSSTSQKEHILGRLNFWRMV